MELDPFTKKLLERTQARRENLNKKEANLTSVMRKRRTPMSDTTNLSSSDDNLSLQTQKKESPKRPCIQNEKDDDTVNNDAIDNKSPYLEDKENSDEMEVDSQNLSETQQNNSNNDKTSAPDITSHSIANNELHEEPITQARSSCKKRLAALAAHINQWEDDVSYHFPSKRFANKTSTTNSVTNSVISNNNSTNDSKKALVNKIHTKQNSDNFNSILSQDSNINNNSSVSTGGGNQALKSIIKKETNKSKQQECQGFTKSPSRSKLEYDFVNNSSKVLAEPVLESVQEEISSDSNTETFNSKNKSVENSEKCSELVNKDVDPAELPLSARRALFEKALIHGNSNKSTNFENPEKLSVAERAALFEKNSGLCCAKTPNFQKNNQNKYNESLSNRKNEISSNDLSQKSGSIQKSSTASVVNELSTPNSPVKLGNYTRKLQHQLLATKDESWQNNEISMKTKVERQKEMAILLNRWECASKTENSDNKNLVEIQNPPCDNQTSNNVAISPKSPLPNENHNNESNSKEIFKDDRIQHTESNIDNSEEIQDDYDETSIEEEEPYIKDNDDDGNIKNTSNLNESEVISQAVAVCEEIDDLLDDALSDDESSNSTESPILVHKSIEVPQTPKAKPVSPPKIKTKPLSPPVSNKTSVAPPATESLPTSIIDNGEEVPLLHTISFYRRKMHEQQLSTPVKKIVRKEEIYSPPSPDEESRIATIQQKIKVLQDEILSQQTIISQATQALNLCHATTEFFGSTEQVEGERLLLIATQRRQAYLNEIQRLKTEGVLKKNLENGMGTLTLTDISLGIKREFLAAQTEGRLDNNVHYFICLIRYGAQLIATQMLSTDGITGNTLNYTNYITLRELESDFCISFEVFALQTKKEMISHDKKYHIKKEHSKLRITPKTRKDSKLTSPAITSPGGPNAVRTSSFALIGFTRLCLKNCNKNSYVLEKVPYQSPLEGTVYMKVQLHAEHKIEERGFLTMFEDVSGFGAWHRRWCILKGNNLAYWKYPDDDKKKEPIGTIDLRHCVTPTVKLVSRDICARPHTFQLISMRPQEKDDRDTLISQSVNTITTTKHLLSADTKEERILWCNRLNDVIGSIRKWDPEALRPIETMQ